MAELPASSGSPGLPAATDRPDAAGQRAASWARNLTVAALVTVVVALPVYLVGTLAVELRRSLHFGTAALGLAVSLHYVGAASFSVPVAWVTDRVGASRVLRVAPFASAVLMALVALVAHSWTVLVILLVPCGMASAAAATATNQFLVRRLPPGRQGVAFGVKQAAIPTASMLGGLAVPVVALTIGWRWAFALGAALAVVACWAVPKPPTSLAARREQFRAQPSAPLALRPLVFLGAGLGLGLFAAGGLAAYLVTAGVAIGLHQGVAGVVTALGAVCAITVRVIIGMRADKRGRGHFVVVAVMMAIGVLGYALLAVSSATHTTWLFIVGALVAFGVGWGWNGLFNFAVTRSHLQAPARATSITQVGGRLGGLTGPFAIGLVADQVSYTAAWLLAGGAVLAACGAVVVGRHLLLAGRGSALG